MKVLDLGCAHGHVFEGWFASEEDYLDQRGRGLLVCPVCGDRSVDKRLSAPYVQTRRASAEDGDGEDRRLQADAKAHQAEWLRRLREWVGRAEDVGERFAAEARAMHEGHAPTRSIRGRASAAEAVELWEEGIPVLPLPDTPLLDDKALH